MSPTRYRIILSGLGLLLALIVVAAVVLAPSGEVVDLPDALERFSPADGAIVQRQTELQIDMRPNYALELSINDVPIPLADLDYTPQTGLYVFRPGAGKVIDEWTPGFHIVEISWDRISGLPDPGSLRWSFRTQ